MVNLTTITQFLNGAIFVLAGISLRRSKSSKLFVFFFWFLAGASYFWGVASLLPNFGFLLEGEFPVSLAGLFYWGAIFCTLASLYCQTRLLLSLVNPGLKDLVSQVVLLWGGFLLFLLATHLPSPVWPTQGLVFWDLPSHTAIPLCLFVGLVSAVDVFLFLDLAMGAVMAKIRWRAFCLAAGLSLFTFASMVQHFSFRFGQQFFLGCMLALGAILMFLGILVSPVDK